MSPENNLILSALPESERLAIEPHLARHDLRHRTVLYDVRDEVTHIYFAHDAVVSLTVPLSTGEVIETAMVGRDGVIGATAALNGRVSLNRAIVQVGGTCLSCPVETFKAILKENEQARSLIGGHEQALFAQAQQSAACNATHAMESRLALAFARLRPSWQH